MSIRDMLARIPDLAAEVWLTRDAPNPGGDSGRHTRTPPTSKPPLSIAAFEALREVDPDGTSETPLWDLTQAVRVAWDEIRDAGLDTDSLPRPAERPSYASEAGWLLKTVDTWELAADLVAINLIDWLVGKCYGELSRLAREPQPLTLRCLVYGCGGRISVDDSGRADECENGHPIDRHEAVRRARHALPMSLPEIAVDLGVTDRTLQRWANSGMIHHVAIDAGLRLFRFDDVRAVHERQAAMRITWRHEA